jgi:hypothetical protein
VYAIAVWVKVRGDPYRFPPAAGTLKFMLFVVPEKRTDEAGSPLK